VVLALRAGVPFIAADPYWHPEAATSKVHQLLTDVGCADRHWTGAPSCPAISDLTAAVLASGADDQDRYALQHVRALGTLEELAATISGSR
jgi:hypothetical protein